MPPRASHLPTSPERHALQKLRAGRELTPRALEPTGKRTVLIWSPRAGSSAGARPRRIGSQRWGSPPCSSRYPRAGNLTSIYSGRNHPALPPLLKLLQAFPRGLGAPTAASACPRGGRFAARHQVDEAWRVVFALSATLLHIFSKMRQFARAAY